MSDVGCGTTEHGSSSVDSADFKLRVMDSKLRVSGVSLLMPGQMVQEFFAPRPTATHCSAQNEKSWQKCSVDSDYETLLINILPIIWQFFSNPTITSARDMATLICKFWEP